MESWLGPLPDPGRRRSRKNSGGTRMKRFRCRLLRLDPHCHYCRCALDHESSTLDHKIPKSRGGKDSRSNLVLACNPCQKQKGARGYEEFMRNEIEPQLQHPPPQDGSGTPLDLDRIAAEWLAARNVIAQALDELVAISLREKVTAGRALYERWASAIIARLASHQPPITLEMQPKEPTAHVPPSPR